MIKNKKAQASILILFLLLAGALGLFSYLGITPNLTEITGGTSGYIERPVFYYDKCEATAPYDYSEKTSLATAGEWLNKPSVSSYYNIKFEVSTGIGTQHRLVYYICNSKVISESNCRVYNKAVSIGNNLNSFSYQIPDNIRINEYVWAQYQIDYIYKWAEASGMTYQIGFIPYGIRQYNVLGGSPNPINPNSCTTSTLSSSWTDRIISTDADKVSQSYPKTTTNQNTLQPDEVRWYVAGYVTSAEPSFALTYNGQDAWCKPTGTSGEIYAINGVTIAGGRTYKIASADWSDYLGSVNCCPTAKNGDMTCDSNFNWVKTAGTECSAFNPCGSSDWTPSNENELIRYSCSNGYCVASYRNVECASSFDCTDTNQVCDLNTYTCVNANVNLNGQTIITIADNQDACEKDGGVWITSTTENKRLWNYIGIGDPEVVVEEYCDMSKTNWVGYIVAIAVILVLIKFHRQILGFGKSILKRLHLG